MYSPPLFQLGKDPFATGLNTGTYSSGIMPASSIFGWQMPELPKLPSLDDLMPKTSDIPGYGSAKDVGKFLDKLGSADLWLRIGFVVMGFVFLSLGVYMLAKKESNVLQLASRLA